MKKNKRKRVRGKAETKTPLNSSSCAVGGASRAVGGASHLLPIKITRYYFRSVSSGDHRASPRERVARVQTDVTEHAALREGGGYSARPSASPFSPACFNDGAPYSSGSHRARPGKRAPI
ncbi:hypothetical protein EYF80_049158 [Liparis tanakae]|uniref:Uncharacterized protein n=1 Tax=Liparis tanakae TaxID=230148 RepID=A0A4Z2FIQ9_9TELE|nr:hypothetical protein EYF80_049158 [Liparis tanakae]